MKLSSKLAETSMDMFDMAQGHSCKDMAQCESCISKERMTGVLRRIL